jgi:outer membrane lipase/esterase
MYFIGDSLTDAGAFTNLVGPTNNRFINNPGTVWAQNLGSAYGIAVTPGYAFNPATLQFSATGGNDYAIGGARVTSTPGVFPPSDAISANIVPATAQITANLAQTGGVANPNALYAVWIGANDVFYQAGVVGALGTAAIPQAGAAIVTAASDEVAQIARLRAAGARNIVVIALPDMGATPYGTLDPAGGALLTGFSTAYNTALAQGLAAAGITQIAYFDPRPLMQDIMARPAAWGITNTTGAACGTISSLGCGTAQQLPNSANYLFADVNGHPTAYTHRIIGDWIYGTLEAPSRMSAMTSLALGSVDSQWRAVDNRVRQHLTGTRDARHNVFVSLDYGPTRFDASANQPALSGSGRNLTVGVDKQWGTTVVGVAAGFSDSGVQFAENSGRIDYRQASLSAFGALNAGNATVDAALSYASLNFDTRRYLGPLTNNGSAGAKLWGAKLGGGYNLAMGDFSHGPVAALLWQKATIDGFSESGITALSYAEQSRTSLRHRIGWQANWKIAGASAQLSPFVRLTHEKEYKDNQGSLSAGIVGTPFSFSVPTRNATGGYGLLAVGTGVHLQNLTASVGVTTTLNRSGQTDRSVSVGLSVPF